MKVKICGITNIDDAVKALELGADAIGFIFYDKSSRFIGTDAAENLITNIKKLYFGSRRKFLSAEGGVITVGVFVNETVERVRRAVDYLGIDIVQLSGDESIEYIECLGIEKKMILKSVRIGNLKDIELINSYKSIGINLLLDAPAAPDLSIYGGTGKVIDLNLLKNLDIGNFVLAGGIAPDNISDILGAVTPYALDLSSRIEKSPGIKDHQKMSLFFENFRRFNDEQNA